MAPRSKISPREDVPQRKRATPERVKPLTLGDLARGGVTVIECACGWCQHQAAVETALRPMSPD